MNVESLIYATGVLVWGVIGIGVLVVMVMLALAAWREVCLYGYILFAEKAEKDELREIGRRRAQQQKDPHHGR